MGLSTEAFLYKTNQGLVFIVAIPIDSHLVSPFPPPAIPLLDFVPPAGDLSTIYSLEPS